MALKIEWSPEAKADVRALDKTTAMFENRERRREIPAWFEARPFATKGRRLPHNL